MQNAVDKGLLQATYSIALAQSALYTLLRELKMLHCLPICLALPLYLPALPLFLPYSTSLYLPCSTSLSVLLCLFICLALSIYLSCSVSLSALLCLSTCLSIVCPHFLPATNTSGRLPLFYHLLRHSSFNYTNKLSIQRFKGTVS